MTSHFTFLELQQEYDRLTTRCDRLQTELAKARLAQSATAKQPHLESLQQECDRLHQPESRY